MSQLLLKILDFVGRIKLDFSGAIVQSLTLGKTTATRPPPPSTDAQMGDGWKEFHDPQKLFEVWGPSSSGPWEYYHTVPLFASLSSPDLFTSKISERERLITPTDPSIVKLLAEQSPPLDDKLLDEKWGLEWLTRRLMVIVELPGVQSVPAAIRFVRSGFQPVCTFDNWPHPRGLLRPELILGQLLRYATTMESLRAGISPESPPVLIADNERLGYTMPSFNDFDNRYFLDDSILPSIEILRREHINGVVCLLPDNLALPSSDLCSYFRSLKKAGFQVVHRCDLSDPSLTPRPFSDKEISEQFVSSKFRFSKSAAGGFGKLIPEPSSGGG